MIDRETIIRLAREAGGSDMEPYDYGAKPDRMILLYEELERFAALVAAAEREACAKVCEEQITGYQFLATHGHFDHMDQAATNCAAAIRARSKNP